MTVRTIRLFGDPVLLSRAEEVTEFGEDNPGLRRLVTDMLATMDEAGGVGLAANQVGVLRRVFVFDTGSPGGLRGHIVNPSVVPIGDDVETDYEGCLSVPGVQVPVSRARSVMLSGVDVDGAPITVRAEGLTARCFQHENDHLDGVLHLKRTDKDSRKQAMSMIRGSEWFNR